MAGDQKTSRLPRMLNAVFLLLGLGLLFGLVVQLDFAEVTRRVTQVGWAYLPATLCFTVGLMASTAAWMRIVDPNASRARFSQCFVAFWAGYALNQVTPTASLGEVLKGNILKTMVEVDELIASLLIFSLISSFASQLFTLIGPLVCLFAFDLPAGTTWILFGIALAMFVPLMLLFVLLRLGLASRFVSVIRRIPLIRPRDPEGWAARAQQVDQRLRDFHHSRPRDLWAAVGLSLVVRVLGAIEAFIFLRPLLPGYDDGFLVVLALLIQTATQIIYWAMTFVPGQLGVSEGGGALLFRMLQLDPLIGFSVILVRRLRSFATIGIGLLIGLWLSARPLRPPDD